MLHKYENIILLIIRFLSWLVIYSIGVRLRSSTLYVRTTSTLYHPRSAMFLPQLLKTGQFPVSLSQIQNFPTKNLFDSFFRFAEKFPGESFVQMLSMFNSPMPSRTGSTCTTRPPSSSWVGSLSSSFSNTSSSKSTRTCPCGSEPTPPSACLTR